MLDKPVEILLIEDSPSEMDLIKNGFEEARIANHITVITDGQEAVDFINMGVVNPDMILLDINQRKGDGFEILRKIRASERGKNTPIVILTPSGTKADVIKSYEGYANSFVNKPDNSKKYTRVVKSIESIWLKASRKQRKNYYEFN
jgi:two-component system, chemotaxis family, response regulator Rcp1